uniref:Genome polyprotein n=1 Tax=Wenzhou pesti-like virus 1 TaxID=2116480 RepID=A0A2P1GMP3_9FLAV|nr:polyprotein [Wenzhou pesti-like virus 1]
MFTNSNTTKSQNKSTSGFYISHWKPNPSAAEFIPSSNRWKPNPFAVEFTPKNGYKKYYGTQSASAEHLDSRSCDARESDVSPCVDTIWGDAPTQTSSDWSEEFTTPNTYAEALSLPTTLGWKSSLIPSKIKVRRRKSKPSKPKPVSSQKRQGEPKTSYTVQRCVKRCKIRQRKVGQVLLMPANRYTLLEVDCTDDMDEELCSEDISWQLPGPELKRRPKRIAGHRVRRQRNKRETTPVCECRRHTGKRPTKLHVWMMTHRRPREMPRGTAEMRWLREVSPTYQPPVSPDFYLRGLVLQEPEIPEDCDFEIPRQGSFYIYDEPRTIPYESSEDRLRFYESLDAFVYTSGTTTTLKHSPTSTTLPKINCTMTVFFCLVLISSVFIQPVNASPIGMIDLPTVYAVCQVSAQPILNLLHATSIILLMFVVVWLAMHASRLIFPFFLFSAFLNPALAEVFHTDNCKIKAQCWSYGSDIPPNHIVTIHHSDESFYYAVKAAALQIQLLRYISDFTERPKPCKIEEGSKAYKPVLLCSEFTLQEFDCDVIQIGSSPFLIEKDSDNNYYQQAPGYIPTCYGYEQDCILNTEDACEKYINRANFYATSLIATCEPDIRVGEEDYTYDHSTEDPFLSRYNCTIKCSPQTILSCTDSTRLPTCPIHQVLIDRSAHHLITTQLVKQPPCKVACKCHVYNHTFYAIVYPHPTIQTPPKMCLYHCSGLHQDHQPRILMSEFKPPLPFRPPVLQDALAQLFWAAQLAICNITVLNKDLCDFAVQELQHVIIYESTGSNCPRPCSELDDPYCPNSSYVHRDCMLTERRKIITIYFCNCKNETIYEYSATITPEPTESVIPTKISMSDDTFTVLNTTLHVYDHSPFESLISAFASLAEVAAAIAAAIKAFWCIIRNITTFTLTLLIYCCVKNDMVRIVTTVYLIWVIYGCVYTCAQPLLITVITKAGRVLRNSATLLLQSLEKLRPQVDNRATFLNPNILHAPLRLPPNSLEIKLHYLLKFTIFLGKFIFAPDLAYVIFTCAFFHMVGAAGAASIKDELKKEAWYLLDKYALTDRETFTMRITNAALYTTKLIILFFVLIILFVFFQYRFVIYRTSRLVNCRYIYLVLLVISIVLPTYLPNAHDALRAVVFGTLPETPGIFYQVAIIGSTHLLFYIPAFLVLILGKVEIYQKFIVLIFMVVACFPYPMVYAGPRQPSSAQPPGSDMHSVMTSLGYNCTHENSTHLSCNGTLCASSFTSLWSCLRPAVINMTSLTKPIMTWLEQYRRHTCHPSIIVILIFAFFLSPSTYIFSLIFGQLLLCVNGAPVTRGVPDSQFLPDFLQRYNPFSKFYGPHDFVFIICFIFICLIAYTKIKNSLLKSLIIYYTIVFLTDYIVEIIVVFMIAHFPIQEIGSIIFKIVFNFVTYVDNKINNNIGVFRTTYATTTTMVRKHVVLKSPLEMKPTIVHTALELEQPSLSCKIACHLSLTPDLAADGVDEPIEDIAILAIRVGTSTGFGTVVPGNSLSIVTPHHLTKGRPLVVSMNGTDISLNVTHQSVEEDLDVYGRKPQLTPPKPGDIAHIYTPTDSEGYLARKVKYRDGNWYFLDSSSMPILQPVNGLLGVSGSPIVSDSGQIYSIATRAMATGGGSNCYMHNDTSKLQQTTKETTYIDPVNAENSLPHSFRQDVEACAQLQPGQTHKINAPTGTGKSTKFPIELVKATQKPILICAPTNVACKGIYDRISETLGNSVSIRSGKHKIGPSQNLIVVSTYGTLISNNKNVDKITTYLSYFKYIMLDESHTHSPEQMVTQALLSCYPVCAIIESSASTEPKFSSPFPVERKVFDPGLLSSDRITELSELASGNTLILLNNIEDTKKLASSLSVLRKSVAFYSGCDPDNLGDFCKNNEDWIVVATPALECGITLPDLKTVIDSGLTNTPTANLNAKGDQVIEMMYKSHIPLSVAVQRSGRVGRTAPGTYYHPTLQFDNQPLPNAHSAVTAFILSTAFPSNVSVALAGLEYMEPNARNVVMFLCNLFSQLPETRGMLLKFYGQEEKIQCINTALKLQYSCHVLTPSQHTRTWHDTTQRPWTLISPSIIIEPIDTLPLAPHVESLLENRTVLDALTYAIDNTVIVHTSSLLTPLLILAGGITAFMLAHPTPYLVRSSILPYSALCDRTLVSIYAQPYQVKHGTIVHTSENLNDLLARYVAEVGLSVKAAGNNASQYARAALNSPLMEKLRTQFNNEVTQPTIKSVMGATSLNQTLLSLLTMSFGVVVPMFSKLTSPETTMILTSLASLLLALTGISTQFTLITSLGNAAVSMLLTRALGSGKRASIINLLTCLAPYIIPFYFNTLVRTRSRLIISTPIFMTMYRGLIKGWQPDQMMRLLIPSCIDALVNPFCLLTSTALAVVVYSLRQHSLGKANNFNLLLGLNARNVFDQNLSKQFINEDENNLKFDRIVSVLATINYALVDPLMLILTGIVTVFRYTSGRGFNPLELVEDVLSGNIYYSVFEAFKNHLETVDCKYVFTSVTVYGFITAMLRRLICSVGNSLYTTVMDKFQRWKNRRPCAVPPSVDTAYSNARIDTHCMCGKEVTYVRSTHGYVRVKGSCDAPCVLEYRPRKFDTPPTPECVKFTIHKNLSYDGMHVYAARDQSIMTDDLIALLKKDPNSAFNPYSHQIKHVSNLMGFIDITQHSAAINITALPRSAVPVLITLLRANPVPAYDPDNAHYNCYIPFADKLEPLLPPNTRRRKHGDGLLIYEESVDEIVDSIPLIDGSSITQASVRATLQPKKLYTLTVMPPGMSIPKDAYPCAFKPVIARLPKNYITCVSYDPPTFFLVGGKMIPMPKCLLDALPLTRYANLYYYSSGITRLAPRTYDPLDELEDVCSYGTFGSTRTSSVSSAPDLQPSELSKFMPPAPPPRVESEPESTTSSADYGHALELSELSDGSSTSYEELPEKLPKFPPSVPPIVPYPYPLPSIVKDNSDTHNIVPTSFSFRDKLYNFVNSFIPSLVPSNKPNMHINDHNREQLTVVDGIVTDVTVNLLTHTCDLPEAPIAAPCLTSNIISKVRYSENIAHEKTISCKSVGLLVHLISRSHPLKRLSYQITASGLIIVTIHDEPSTTSLNNLVAMLSAKRRLRITSSCKPPSPSIPIHYQYALQCINHTLSTLNISPDIYSLGEQLIVFKDKIVSKTFNDKLKPTLLDRTLYDTVVTLIPEFKQEAYIPPQTAQAFVAAINNTLDFSSDGPPPGLIDAVRAQLKCITNALGCHQSSMEPEDVLPLLNHKSSLGFFQNRPASNSAEYIHGRLRQDLVEFFNDLDSCTPVLALQTLMLKSAPIDFHDPSIFPPINPHKPPRIIQYGNLLFRAAAACAYGTYWRDGLVGGSHMSLMDQVRTIADYWFSYQTPAALCLDISKFDVTLSSPILDILLEAEVSMYPKQRDKDRIRKLRAIEILSLGLLPDGTLIHRCRMRGSGEIDTSLGNTLLNEAILRTLTTTASIPADRIKFLVCGDDAVLVGARDDIMKIADHAPKFYNQMNMKLSLAKICTDLTEITFCSHSPSPILDTSTGKIHYVPTRPAPIALSKLLAGSRHVSPSLLASKLTSYAINCIGSPLIYYTCLTLLNKLNCTGKYIPPAWLPKTHSIFQMTDTPLRRAVLKLYNFDPAYIKHLPSATSRSDVSYYSVEKPFSLNTFHYSVRCTLARSGRINEKLKPLFKKRHLIPSRR